VGGDPLRSVAILTPSYYDFDGSRIFHGGGERYLRELGRVLRDNGYYVELFQAATHDWVRHHEGFVFHGLSPLVFVDDMWPATNERFREEAGHFDHHIYFTFSLAYPEARPDSLAISHGIWWDDSIEPWRRTPQWCEKMEKALSIPQRIIANDTNIINWARAIHPELERRFHFVPNFVDLNEFRPRPKTGNPHMFTVLFPRRLAPQRGWREALKAAQTLVAAHPDIEFYFVGRGTPTDEAILARTAEEWPQIHYEWREPDQMAEAFQMADLVLIPTLSAEGTSLSCLEAMASGRPVIAGWVGGLTNLIIHEYNGLLIRVTPNTLVESILYLKQNPGLRELFAARGLEVAAAHSLERWRASWTKLIERYLTRPSW